MTKSNVDETLKKLTEKGLNLETGAFCPNALREMLDYVATLEEGDARIEAVSDWIEYVKETYNVKL